MKTERIVTFIILLWLLGCSVYRNFSPGNFYKQSKSGIIYKIETKNRDLIYLSQDTSKLAELRDSVIVGMVEGDSTISIPLKDVHKIYTKQFSLTGTVINITIYGTILGVLFYHVKNDKKSGFNFHLNF